jgi:selenide,water dikinase
LKLLLERAGLSITSQDSNILAGPLPAEDSAIIKLTDQTCLVQSVDFFTPIVDEPETQGEIAACNVTNDLYAKGALNILGVLVVMGFPPEMPNEAAVGLLKGFSNCCRKLGTLVIGGHTISNPWPILGGAATATMKIKDIVYKKGAKQGDNLLITKPLGVQPVMAAYRILDEPDLNEELLKKMSLQTIKEAIGKTISLMTTTNKPVAEAMVEVKTNAATDITGFGLIGHASEVAEQSLVDMEITSVPVIKGSLQMSDILGYSLREGLAHETAGGMLLSVSPENTARLVASLKKRKVTPYIIGKAKKGTGIAALSTDVRFIEV